MAIEVSCSHCAKTYPLPEHLLGKNVQCASCRKVFQALADAPPPGMFATRCSHCNKRYAAPERLRGQRTTCQSCRQVFVAAPH